MVTFRNNNNNNRRPQYRTNNNRRPQYRSNNEGSNFSNKDNFRRNVAGRNNHNASKLIEKYNEMAREALANEDRVLSESYFQHADHFTRVQNEQESVRMARVNLPPAQSLNSIKNEIDEANTNVKTANIEEVKINVKTANIEEAKELTSEPKIKKVIKNNEKKSVEKKLATI